MDYSSDDSVADKDFVPPSPLCRISSSSMCSTESDEDRRSVHNQSNADEGNVVCKAQPKKRSRKRQRNEQEWEVNKRKDARNKGLEYVSSRKKLMPAKKIRKSKDCLNKCVFKCSQKITDDERCDLCEEVPIKYKEGHTLTSDLQEKINRHKTEKMAARSNRDKDRKGTIPVLCFDLENVLSCPKAEVSNFFYKSKFSTYNMTGHLSTNKKVYCAIWSENTAGRSGNDIASAVYKILTQVLLDNPHFTSIILWSDSCVPQNRNSIMSFALRQLIDKFSTLEQITSKFSTPGHSCIQEIDNVHSCIDRVLLKAEYYSPVSLMRLLLQEANSAKKVRDNPCKVFNVSDLARRIGLLRDLETTTLENCQSTICL
ncbi:unnamed protein product [Euphydryas editha]|uniref:Uncharacterized protein n=1 Tax=Euphydryas editha TaxID=104508 RepID=A0AAU9UST6_EUPED|nr:unnamed protein product [Euphydryas editha]